MPISPETVHASAASQGFLNLIGAKLTHVAPGEAEFTIPFRPDLTQQHRFIHGGVVTTIADVACGYAAYTLMPEGSEVLAVEFKVNLLRPGVGDHFIARARVIKPGKTLTVCQADVFAVAASEEKLIAVMTATVIRQ